MQKYTRFSPQLTKHLKYYFQPVSCYKIQSKPNPVVCVTLGNEKGTFCDIHFRLFENVVPKTAQNFKRLLLGTGNYKGRPLSLINTPVFKFVPRAYFLFGNMDQGNCSIFGPKFRDQSFELLHDKPGLLTSISDENTNSSLFAVTLAPAPYMDLKNVVFGEVTANTYQNLRELEKYGKDALTLRILSTELLPTPVHHDDHGHHHDHDHEVEHHHGHQHHEPAHADDAIAGHHGLKHTHNNPNKH